MIEQIIYQIDITCGLPQEAGIIVIPILGNPFCHYNRCTEYKRKDFASEIGFYSRLADKIGCRFEVYISETELNKYEFDWSLTDYIKNIANDKNVTCNVERRSGHS